MRVVDEEPALAQRFQTRSIPTLLLAFDGREVARAAGAVWIALRAVRCCGVTLFRASVFASAPARPYRAFPRRAYTFSVRCGQNLPLVVLAQPSP